MGKRETLSAQDRERQYIVDYLAGEVTDEAVEHLEKVKTERVLGRQMDGTGGCGQASWSRLGGE